MRKWIVLLFYILIVIPFTISNGKFYVGFLRYSNRGNLKMDGTCCDGTIGVDGKCHVTCDLMFQVSTFGLDNVNMTNKRPSRLPINDSNSFIFMEEYKDAINPITFDFRKWPGKVHLVVQVFDQDHDSASSNNTLEAVDDMDFYVKLDEPSLHFVYQNMTGNRRRKPSEIMLLFRYECGPTYYGVDCMTDCLMYPSSSVCPRTSTPRPSSSTQLPTEPLTPTTECTSTAAELTTPTTETTERWTTDSTTQTVSTTTPVEPTTESSTTVASSSTSVRVTPSVSNVETSSAQQTEATGTSTQTSTSETSPSTSEITERQTSETTTSLQSTEKNSSTSSSVTTSAGTSVDLSTLPTVSNTSPGTNTRASSTEGTSSITGRPSSSIRPSKSTPSTTSKTASEGTTITFSASKTTRTLIPKTSPPLPPTDKTSPHIVSTGVVDATSNTAQTTIGSHGKPTEYSHVIQDDPNYDWAIIVGCVLAGLAIMALILFMVYRNRQKTRLKRQEIYNVSPEVMSVVEENGTTERSDVPITTSPL